MSLHAEAKFTHPFMPETKPSSPDEPPPPNDEPPNPDWTEPSEPSVPNNDAEQIEQLLQANAELQEELSLARRELAAVGPLLLSFGEATWRCILNARSIRSMSLRQEMEAYGSAHSGMVTLKPAWAVLVDEVMVTPYLPEQEAVDALAAAEAAWAEALSPPTQ